MMSLRIEKWDNLKGVLIYLVVLGHLADLYTGSSESARELYFFIYIFHMPLFIFLSGLFSKRYIQEKRYDKITTYLILYFVVKMLRCFVDMLVSQSYAFHLFESNGEDWYCFALFWFCLITIFLSRLEKRYVLVFSILLACFTGYDTTVGDRFVLSRIVVFFPFFYLGYCLNEENIRKFLEKKVIQIISALILIALAVFVLAFGERIYGLRPMLTGRNPFHALGDYAPLGGLIRFCYYVPVALIGACVISVVPEKVPWGGIALIGKRSLQVYALHRPLFTLMYKLGMQKVMDRILPGHSIWLIFPIAAFITLFCSLKVFEPLFEIIKCNGWRRKRGM